MSALLELFAAAQQWIAAHPLESLLIIGFFWAGCPCCGESCTLFLDAFGDTTIDGWTQTAGTWTESSGKARTSSSDAFLTCNTAHPTGLSRLSASVKVSLATSGDVARLVIASDGADYHYLEAKAGTHVKLFRYVSSSATEIADLSASPPTSTEFTLTLCIDGGGLITATYESTLDNVSGETFAGDGAALATGTLSGEATFDDFVLVRTDDECPSCAIDCPNCVDAKLTISIQVDIANIDDNGFVNCSDLNGSYITDFASAACQRLLDGSFEVTTAGASFFYERVAVQMSGPGADAQILDLTPGQLDGISWSHASAEGPCNPLAPVVLAFSAYSPAAPANRCNANGEVGTPSTATIYTPT